MTEGVRRRRRPCTAFTSAMNMFSRLSRLSSGTAKIRVVEGARLVRGTDGEGDGDGDGGPNCLLEGAGGPSWGLGCLLEVVGGPSGVLVLVLDLLTDLGTLGTSLLALRLV